MKTQCPYCQQHYEVDDEFLGATVSCETCKRDFVIEELVEKKMKKPIMTALNACKKCGKMIPAEDKLCPDCFIKNKKRKEKLYPLGIMVGLGMLFIAVAVIASIPSKEQREIRSKQQMRQKIQDKIKESLAYLNNNSEILEFSLSPYSFNEVNIMLKNQTLPKNYELLCDSVAKTVSTILMEQKREDTTCTAYLKYAKGDNNSKLYLSTAKNGQISKRDLTSEGIDTLSPDEKKIYLRKHNIETFEKDYVNSDGSVEPVVEYVKGMMKNPDSFQHVKSVYTSVSDTNIRFRVIMSYRGTNSFGGVVPGTIEVDVSCTGYVFTQSFRKVND